jgi:uncharacterized membrane protein
MKNNNWSLGKTAVVAALTGLAALSTMIIRIPIPASEGYFNIGDVFVILAGLWLGPTAGLIVGAVGPTIADAIGYPQFILATFIIKGTEGLLVGLIGGGQKEYSLGRRTFAATTGGIIIIAGYFLFEAYIYPFIGNYIPFFKVTDLGGAVGELPANIAQAIIGIVGGLALWRPLGKSLDKKQ